ncbi:MAG: type II toxin-antitoxin system PemK/MazF family toxin [Holosporales bacterium]
MRLPEPIPGLVVPYSYLWWYEDNKGLDEGRKVRPCAIVLSAQHEDGQTIVTVVPITHAKPDAMNTTAVEIPLSVKKHLGLDSQRSWVITNEVNQFFWPGPDLKPILKGSKKRYAYGVLPPKLFKMIKQSLLETVRAKRLKAVKRTDS